MTATVIDQLIVKLGLDPKDFQKGKNLVIVGLKDINQQTQKVAKEGGMGLDAMAAKYFKLAAVIVAAKKVIGYTSDLSTNLRQLGIDAKNLNIAADQLKNWQNVSEMMGGDAKQATASIAGLQKAVYDLAYNGQMSDSLIMLARLGVQFQDTAGNARDFKSIVLDTQKQVQSQMKNGTLTRANANNMLAQAGFDPGISRAILDGTAGSEYSRQEGRRQVTGSNVAHAEDWERSGANRSQTIDAAALRGFDAGAEGGTFLNDKISQGVDYLDSGHVMQDAGKLLHEGAQTFDHSVNRMEKWFTDVYARGFNNSHKGTTLGMSLNNPGNLRVPGGVRFQQFGTLEEGVLKANRQMDLYAKRGIDTIDEIVNTWAPRKSRGGDNSDAEVDAYIANLEKSIGVDRNHVLGEGDRAQLLSAMFNQEQGKAAAGLDSSAVADILQAQVPTPNSAAARSSTTNIDIGEVTVNTQATDANGIARDISGALRRKAMAAHAERGQQ